MLWSKPAHRNSEACAPGPWSYNYWAKHPRGRAPRWEAAAVRNLCTWWERAQLLATREKPEQQRRSSTAKRKQIMSFLKEALVKSIQWGGRSRRPPRGQTWRQHMNTPGGLKKCILLKWGTFYSLKLQKLAVYDKNNFPMILNQFP